jgi:hypothetical protein
VKSITIQITRLDYFIGQCRMQLRHPVNVGGWMLLAIWTTWMGFPGRGRFSIQKLLLAFVVAALACAVVLIIVGLLVVCAMTMIARKERGLIGEHTFTLTDAGLIESTVSNENLIKWGGARALVRTGRYFYVRVTYGSYHTIPCRNFPDRAAEDEFWKALQPLVAKKVS